MPVGTLVEVPAGSEIDKVVATVSPLEILSEKDEYPDSVFTTQGVHLQSTRNRVPPGCSARSSAGTSPRLLFDLTWRMVGCLRPDSESSITTLIARN